METEFQSLHFSTALEASIALATAGNVWLDERAPWAKLKKEGEERAEAEMVECC